MESELVQMGRKVKALERELEEAHERGELQETQLHNECQAHAATRLNMLKFKEALQQIDTHGGAAIGGTCETSCSAFRREVESAINRHSMENGSNTPDFILANYLQNCLSAFDIAVKQRDKWYGKGAA